ncbi:MAG: phytoene desaturase family protein [Cytophagaceae bacterium]
MKKIAVIGSGFSGLASACALASKGCDVTVFEKNDQTGGRARTFQRDGFTFDMGPSWYWMPEVFENFFNEFGHSSKDFYELIKLSPSYTLYFGEDDPMPVPSEWMDLVLMFEKYDPSSGKKLAKFMGEAAFKYKLGIEKLVHKPGLSVFEFADMDVIRGIFKLQVFTSFRDHVRRYFRHPKLIALMEFPVLFLGAKPENTPALYSLMNYAGLKLGTWYPMGGFGKITEAMKKVALEQGVKFRTGEAITEFTFAGKKITGIKSGSQTYQTDAVLASADYHHVEQHILPPHLRSYSEEYWHSRTLAPSALIFYLGINKKLSRIDHHNLFFDEDIDVHSKEIYDDPSWPSKPLFYVCCPSKTDASVAPAGSENLFFLMPLAPDLKDDDQTREKYFEILISRFEKVTGEKIRENIVVKESYCINDFKKDYNSFKGNAYGLANTLKQTAILKPSMRSKKVKNLFYTGQLTVPGPGVPPSIISGQVAAKELINYFNNN